MKLGALENPLGKVVERGCFDSDSVFGSTILIALVALIAECLLTMIEDQLLT